MAFSDSGTDSDSNFEIPGGLSDTIGSPAGRSEPRRERPRAIDPQDHLRATSAVLDSRTIGRSPSSLLDTPDAPAPVGLSDPEYVSKRRKMLDTVNRLRATGAQLELDIPIIVVVGSQSAGKSSLIEAISGITLPRASGTCTRCPTECQLSRSNGPWRCAVSLRIATEDGSVLQQPRKVDFGDPIYSKSLVTERIRRAQCAILNPGTPVNFFLDAPPDALEEKLLSFSSNSVCLEISGREVEDLSFVDLPGLIVGGVPRDAHLVQQLAEEHIRKESCIILLTIACETDFENQSAHRLAERFDPQGSRTIGVLTKPDRIPPGEESIWISRIQGGGNDEGVKYYSVINPESQEIRNGITYEQAREKEAEFFSTKAPWSDLDRLYKRRLGTDKLTRHLGQVLSDLISKRLPELQGELDRLLNQVNDAILNLPEPPSSEPMVEMMNRIGNFVGAIEHIIAGAPEDGGLIQALSGPQEQFKRDIRQTAPNFRPLEKPKDVDAAPVLPQPPFLSNEETESEWQPDMGQIIFVDEVMNKAKSARSRELPNNYPYVVRKQYIGKIVEQWKNPSRKLFEITNKELSKHVKLQIERNFSLYTHGQLKQRVTSIMKDHLDKCAEAATKHIDSLREEEEEPFTMNEHYFSDYRSKFLTFYRDARRSTSSRSIRSLENRDDGDMIAVTSDAQPSPTKMGSESNASILANLASADPMDPAIEIMADVRAYFQVAYKRFVDHVPMGIDRTLVRGVTRDLQGVLLSGLGVNGPEGYKRCKMLLSEPEDISERRRELEMRQKRLLSAKEELIEVLIFV